MINRIVGFVTQGYTDKNVVELSLMTCDKGQLCFDVRVSEVVYKYCMEEMVKIGVPENNVSLLIHEHKTEQADTLYGFLTEEERRIFREFVKIDRLGPATAIKILGFPIETIRSKVISGDWKFFSMISGIGEKTAKSIILELQKRYMRKG